MGATGSVARMGRRGQHLKGTMPMNQSLLFSLSNHLSQHITVGTADESTGCDHTFCHTLAWITAHNLDQEAWLGWLQQRGGWCDCTIVVEVLLALPEELGESVPPLPLAAFRSWQREL